MEKTAESEQKFRALYLGQDVYLEDFKRCQTTLNVAPMNLWPADDKSDILELKPLSSITDEDAKNLPSGGFVNKERVYQYYSFDKCGDLLFIKSLKPEDYDFLRSKGYALPYMGVSVEELVNRGWVKLKEANNG